MQDKRDNTVDAYIHIINCKNVTATIDIYGFSAGINLGSDPFTRRLFGDRLHKPKYSATIYVDYDKKAKNHIVSWGRHQLDDKILEYRSKC